MSDEMLTKQQFRLLKTDNRDNRYYIYPDSEMRFKKDAFECGSIIVKIIYPDGHVEVIKRRVTKLWETEVLWNINSMPIHYKKHAHISYASNLVVYAYPSKHGDLVL